MFCAVQFWAVSAEYVFAVKSLLDLSRFWLTFRARTSRDAINDGRADVSCQLRVGVFFFEYIVFLLDSFVRLM